MAGMALAPPFLPNHQPPKWFFSSGSYISTILLRGFLPLLLIDIVASQSIIKTLPGFPGSLPFKLETGYIGVGDLDDVQLFYYFIESERSPKDDPLFLWLTGGPGPFTFNYANSSGNKPQLTLNPYSWTKVANIIFLDAPVGTGFSYANTWEGYNSSDTISAAQIYTFLRKWFMAHPNFLTNPLYITGDSYSGKIVPRVVVEIANGNEIGHEPPMYIQGIVLGNPVTDENKDINSRIPYAHLKALISDELYESTKRNCNGQYIDVDPSNALCINDLQTFVECTGKVYIAQIMEPTCSFLSPKSIGLKWDLSTLRENSKDVLSLLQRRGPWCRSYNYVYSYIWANDKTVRKALHIREGTTNDWVRCNKSLSYTKDIPSSVIYHRDIIKKGYRVLIYSGDNDMAIPYVGTLTWIKSLNLTIEYDWSPWFVDGQVAGTAGCPFGESCHFLHYISGGYHEIDVYTIEYYYKKYSLTYATVKGGGHTAPEYKPKECLAMLDRWLAHYPL